jgi:hypothetical protein
LGLQADGAGASRDPEVEAALRLTAGQRERIRVIEEDAVFGWMRAVRPGAAPGAPGPREVPANERILAVLSEEQSRRWREMTGEPVKGPLYFFPPPGPKRDPKVPGR